MKSDNLNCEDGIYSDPTGYPRKIEPTQKAYSNPYEDTSPYHGNVPDIPPPPPKQRRVWFLPLLLGTLCIVIIAGSLLFIVGYAHNQKAHTSVVMTPTAIPTAPSTPTANLSYTASVEATATQESVYATATASVPTPTPLPAINTAQDIYTQFTTAGIAMGNAGDVPHSWWLQCCSYYPGKGSILFTDETSGGEMVIALFGTVNGVQTDVAQMDSKSSHPGDYQLGMCLLLHWSASTNLTPYEQVMQQYCV